MIQFQSAELSSGLSRCTEIGQRSADFNIKSEDESSFRSVLNSIRDSMSVFSIENIREATSDLMSLLSNSTHDDDRNNSIQDMSDASTPRGGNSGPDLNLRMGSVISKREVQSMADHFPLYWGRNDDETSYNSRIDDCNICGIVNMHESVPSTESKTAPSLKASETEKSGNDNSFVQKVGDRSFLNRLRSLKRDCNVCFHDFSDGTLNCSTRTELTGNKSQQLEVQACLF